MDEQLVERIALEVARESDVLDEDGECPKREGAIITGYVLDFAHKFLSRIDAERGKDAAAWLHDIIHNDDPRQHDEALSFSPDAFPMDGCGLFSSIGSRPLFLSLKPAMPSGWTIERVSGEALIVRKEDVGGYVAEPNAENIASEILHALASDLISIAAAPSEPFVRDAVIEEVAKWYEETGWLLDEGDVATAIRALKVAAPDAQNAEPVGALANTNRLNGKLADETEGLSPSSKEAFTEGDVPLDGFFWSHGKRFQRIGMSSIICCTPGSRAESLDPGAPVSRIEQ